MFEVLTVQVGSANAEGGNDNTIMNGIEVLKISNSVDNLDGEFGVDGRKADSSNRGKWWWLASFFSRVWSHSTICYAAESTYKRDSDMNLVYDGGEEAFFDNVNPEKMNLMVMKDLFKGLGYKEYNYMYWLDEDLGMNGVA
ncbi:hypothetical protein PIB30_074131 [Stylosanthes scabra]|uniref:PB1-like domain-containing protein n=1 Tax=Stylosanthes scabra TaxID=79078 RepID=A0ABU6VP21_9FABA|nr:hypothetical protein [Stylosanthes scabra]